jgi:DNA polymerase I-like protein with 3'-5' exonuclease and polymerase domains
MPSAITAVFHHVEADLDHLGRLLGHHRVQVNIEDTMYLHAVLWSDLDHDLDFLGSLYARTNRWKHLLTTNPRVYAGGDALGTWDAYVPLSQELERDPQVRKVYYDYQLPLATIIHKARGYGQRVIPERVGLALATMDRLQEESTRLAQAHVGWPLNLGSPAQVGRELYEIERIHLNPVSGRFRR